MPTTTITFIIFGVICLCIGAIYFAQARERARVEKIRRTNMLNERYKRMQQLLHELPPQYLNNDLRIMIAERSVETLNDLIRMNNDNRHKNYLADDHEYLKQLREKNPKFKPVPVQTEAKAKEVRSILEVLQRFIQTQHKNKRINGSAANKYLDQITLSICQSKADLHCSRAAAANKIGKPRVAIHNYHGAIDAFKTFAQHPQAAKAIAGYKAQIKALEKLAEQQSHKAESGKEASSEDKEWDSFLDKKDDSWQKKNQYD